MSDSDDTDVLLLIPPDFFIVNNPKRSFSNDSLTNNTNSCSNCIDDNSTIVSNLNNNNNNKHNHQLVSTISADEELESLNNRLFEINNNNNNSNNYNNNNNIIMNGKGIANDDDTMVNYQEFSSMPTSTASHNYQSTPNYKYYNLKSNQMDEQQPQSNQPPPPAPKIPSTSQPLSFQSNYIGSNQIKRDNQHPPIITQKDDRFLREIDYFLIGNNSNINVVENNVKSLPLSANYLNDPEQPPPSLPSAQNDEKLHTFANEMLNRHSKMLNKQKSKIVHTNNVVAARTANLNDSAQLMSLSNIWGPEGQQETETIEEERIRRQHCEKTIQVLQSKLLEYQQKISVAIKIDKTKDTAIGKYHEANSTLTAKLSKTEHRLIELEEQLRNERKYLQIENDELKDKNRMMDSELLQTIGMVKKFQERNELLESKLDNLTISTNDIQDIHRKQLEDLEIRFSNSKHIESELNTEMTILKNSNKKLQCELDKISKSYNEIKKITDDNTNELEIVKEQKRNLSEKLHAERERYMNLESRKNNLQHTIDVLNEKEKTFVKELETQRITLKAFYQNQLEQVVGQKVKEFQKEIDKLDEVLKSDGKRRERLIAERAIKQMQLMNEKNEQEYQLITQKHNEEIALYRLQLDNSTQTINELQSKLNAYQSKRADIAERLHNVMEIQWQKALEIITSPNNNVTDGGGSCCSSRTTNEQKQFYANSIDDKNQCAVNNSNNKSINVKKLDKDRVDGVAGLLYMQQTQTRAENETFETPTSSRQRNDTNEKLQAYIELLLKTSPRDLNQIIPPNYLDLTNRDDDVDADKSIAESKQHQMEKKNTSLMSSYHQIKSLPPWK